MDGWRGVGVMFRLSLASMSYSSFDHSRYVSPPEFLWGLQFAQTVSTALISDSIDSFFFFFPMSNTDIRRGI